MIEQSLRIVMFGIGFLSFDIIEGFPDDVESRGLHVPGQPVGEGLGWS
jgi:hypothetical protein